ncbi:unnamed protein product [Sympodiomycopsis kandeliae]
MASTSSSSSAITRLALEPQPPTSQWPASAGAASSSSSNASGSKGPLSERLHRLWTERGDFSKFSLDDLDDLSQQDTLSKRVKQDDDSSLQADIDWGYEGGERQYLAEFNQLISQSDPHSKGKGKEQSSEYTIDTSAMTMEEFLRLKEEMIARLAMAQQSLYSSQALVALLVASNRSKSNLSESVTRNPSLAPSRAESPSLATASSSDKDKRHPVGSVAAVEAEFGLDPYSIALASIEPQRNHSGKEEQVEFANDAERDEYNHRLRSSLFEKKRSVTSAISILRKGAQRLDDLVTHQRGEEDLTSASASPGQQRWKSLREAQRDGWKLTPGRPGTNANANVRSDEGEQDAWIGYGVPESRPLYRKTCLAYFSSSSDKIVFAARRNKRLQLSCIVNGHTVVSPLSRLKQAQEECTSTGSSPSLQLKEAQEEVVDAHNYTSDRSPSSQLKEAQEEVADAHNYTSDRSPSSQLKEAQEEVADAELFDDIVHQARVLDSMGLLDCQLDTTTGMVVLHLSSELQLEFKLQSTQSTQSTQEDNVESSSGQERVESGVESSGRVGPGVESSGRVGPGVESSGRVEPEDNLESASDQSTSAYASLLLSLARLSMIKRYTQRANADRSSRIEAYESRRNKKKKPQPTDLTDSIPGTPTSARKKITTTTQATTTTASSQDAWKSAPFLMPCISLIHYFTFVDSIKSIVASYTSFSNNTTYTLSGTTSLTSPNKWLNNLLSSSTSEEVSNAIKALSGTGSISVKDKVVLKLYMRYPSQLTVHLPTRQAVNGEKGIRLEDVDIGTLREILGEELKLDMKEK